MKKTLMIITLMLFCVSGFAQPPSESGHNDISVKKSIKFGALMHAVFGGLTANNITGDDDSYDSPLIGGEVGVAVPIIGFNKHSGLGAELEYAMRGSKYHDTYGNGKLALAYLMLPVYARFLSAKGVFGEVGVQPAYLVSAKDKYAGTSHNYKDNINSFDMGVLIGTGYVINKSMGVGLRYSHGLTNIVKGSNNSSKDYNSTFALRLMWYIGASAKKK